MPPLNKGALAIALLPTVVVSFLAQAYIGPHAAARAASFEVTEPFEGASTATFTSAGCDTERQAERSSESQNPPPSFLAP